jgi:ornithine cyclodeaminase/alanine dehydrogenase-like protein (mu-crystallin family)
MRTLVLTAADVQQVVRHVGADQFMDLLIGELEQVCDGQSEEAPCEIPMRDGFHYRNPTDGLIEWMPLLTPDHTAMMKLVGYHPGNPDGLGTPSVISSLIGFDTSTGHVAVFAEGTLLTAMRTGAASAVATRILAKESASTVGLIGAGAQAVSQLHALGRVLEIERVLVHDTNPAAAASFHRRVAGFASGLEVIVADAESVAAQADVLCTVTSVEAGSGPVFRDTALRDGLHVNAVGADFPGKFELPQALLERAFVCPDFPPQALQEGESQRLPPEALGPDLIELVKGRSQYQAKRRELTVFDSTGFALEDHVALEVITRLAGEIGVGTTLTTSAESDARNPYSGLFTEGPKRSIGEPEPPPLMVRATDTGR